MINNLEICPNISNEICKQYCDLDTKLCMEVSQPQVLFDALARLSMDRDQQSFLASHDALTGLWNKSKWDALANERILDAQKTDKDLGLLFIDLTNFKKVNDVLGHTTGDGLLKGLASLVTSTLRDSDIGRSGGDEFVVLCDLSPHRDKTTSPRDRLTGVTDRLRNEFDIFFESRTAFSSLGATAAVGNCLWTPDMTLDDLVTHADSDMRAVKKIQHQQSGKYRT